MKNNQQTVFSLFYHPIRVVTWATISIQLFCSILLMATPALAADALNNDPIFGKQNYRLNAKQDAAQARNQQLANTLLQNANTASTNNSAALFNQQARSLAGNQLTSQLQSALAPYGTVRAQLGVDEHFKLSNSELDVLLPWSDNQARLLFSQFGLRHEDNRTTMNIGLGQRHFLQTKTPQMLGYNVFYDHEVTNNNRRLGLGAEWGRDHLKLSANGYLRLSQWQQAYKLIDYNERPANGFDLRIEGYFPTLPQWGVTVKYEQYFGQDVALFGQDRRQNDPLALTTGINYTPFPLMTLGVAHKQGRLSQQDTQISLGLNYQLGTPWQKQISAAAVAEKRLLAGSRQQLVERNNTIVLEYQQQDFVTLSLPTSVTGDSGSSIPLNLQVAAKYGLDRIVFDDSALVAAGGGIISSGEHYQLILPTIPAGENQTFPISAVAYDKKGNASTRESSKIIVQATMIDLNLDTDAQEATVGNNITATVTLKDQHDKPIEGQVVTFTVNNDAHINGNPKTITTDSNGNASVEVSNTKAGKTAITATLDNGKAKMVEVNFLADVESANIVKFEEASGNPTTEMTIGEPINLYAKLLDQYGNPVVNQNVDFKLDNIGEGLKLKAIPNGSIAAEGKYFVNITSEYESNLNNKTTIEAIVNVIVDGKYHPLKVKLSYKKPESKIIN